MLNQWVQVINVAGLTPGNSERNMKHPKTTNHQDGQDWHTCTNSPCQDSKLVQWGTWALQINNWVGLLPVAVRTQELGLVQGRSSVGLKTNKILHIIH